MHKAISKDGTTIAYDRLGSGPALILVAGALTVRTDATPLAELLAADFTVFNYDRRGRGDSGDTAPFHLSREIEDIQALLDDAGGTAHVFGHSSGAALAIEAARVLPGITKLALYEPPFIVDDSRPPLPADYVSHLQRLTAEDRREEIIEYFMTVAVGLPAEYLAPMREDPMWARSVALAHTVAYDGAAVAHNMLGKPLPTEWTTSVTVPTLVLDGENSPAWQHTATQALTNLLPHATHQTLPNADHGAPPTQLAPTLTPFLL